MRGQSSGHPGRLPGESDSDGGIISEAAAEGGDSEGPPGPGPAGARALPPAAFKFQKLLLPLLLVVAAVLVSACVT